VFNQLYRDKKVVGVFVRFRAPPTVVQISSHLSFGQIARYENRVTLVASLLMQRNSERKEQKLSQVLLHQELVQQRLEIAYA
jgi:hypothetical protein